MKNPTTLNDLRLAHKELLLHEKEIEKCTDNLKITKEKLEAMENKEEQFLKEAHYNLEEMMFTVSHKIRKSVANILGISRVLSEEPNLKEKDLKDFLEIIIYAAESLNRSTEDLTTYIYIQRGKLKKAPNN